MVVENDSCVDFQSFLRLTKPQGIYQEIAAHARGEHRKPLHSAKSNEMSSVGVLEFIAAAHRARIIRFAPRNAQERLKEKALDALLGQFMRPNSVSLIPSFPNSRLGT